jgi:hypothetical protein
MANYEYLGEKARIIYSSPRERTENINPPTDWRVAFCKDLSGYIKILVPKVNALLELDTLIHTGSQSLLAKIHGDEPTVPDWDRDVLPQVDKTRIQLNRAKISCTPSLRQGIRNQLAEMGVADEIASLLSRQWIRIIFPKPDTTEN